VVTSYFADEGGGATWITAGDILLAASEVGSSSKQIISGDDDVRLSRSLLRSMVSSIITIGLESCPDPRARSIISALPFSLPILPTKCLAGGGTALKVDVVLFGLNGARDPTTAVTGRAAPKVLCGRHTL